MREEDIPEVIEIERHSFPHPWPESAYRNEIRYGTDSLFYVLQPYREPSPATWWDRLLRRRQGRQSPVIGYVGMRFLPGEAHITTIAVHPQWRGRGLGKYILLMAIQRALQHCVRFVTLEVRASNWVAQRLYTDLGFRVIGIQRGYYRDGEDAWLMRLGPLDKAETERLEEILRATEARALARDA
jgi:ribosomal-protein-alanine N-acetyltransferase